MRSVRFLRAGHPYGYGYAVGERGTVSDDGLSRLLAAGVVELDEVRSLPAPSAPVSSPSPSPKPKPKPKPKKARK